MYTKSAGRRGLIKECSQLLKLFWPVIIGQLAQAAMGVTDTVMAGSAGTLQLSGVAVGTSLFFPCQLALVGLTLGIQPIVSQLRGAGLLSKIPRRMWTAFTVCMLGSVFFMGLLFILRTLLTLVPSDPLMLDVASRYVFWTALALPGVGLYNVMRSYAEGLGQTRPTLIFGLVTLALNIPLNYIFIFGKCGMPELGGEGCGVATMIATYIAAILFVIYIRKASFCAPCRILTKCYVVSLVSAQAYLKVGLPLCLSLAFEVACFSLGSLIVSPFGPVVVAAHSITLNVSGLFFMVPHSLAIALTIRTGTAVGAQRLDRAMLTCKGGMTLSLIFYLLSLFALYIFRPKIASCYTDDPKVAAYTISLMLYNCVYLLPDTLQMGCIGILRGFKDTRTIMKGTFLSYWMIAVPSGYLLAWGYLGTEPMMASGIWMGFIFGLTAAALFYVRRVYHIFKDPSIVGVHFANETT